MSFAPCIASSTVSTIFSFSVFSLSSCLVTYCFAISSIGVFSSCSYIIFAKGSSPLAFATVALVFFFCLYGLYISSTSASVFAFSNSDIISSVSFPWFSIEVFTSCFLSSKFLR